MRLLEFDDSKEFKINVNIKENVELNDGIQIMKESTVIIKTTTNKARVISNNINNIYKQDQSVDHYEINLVDINEKKKTQKIIQAFNIILNSIGKENNVPEELNNIFSKIEETLGENQGTQVPPVQQIPPVQTMYQNQYQDQNQYQYQNYNYYYDGNEEEDTYNIEDDLYP